MERPEGMPNSFPSRGCPPRRHGRGGGWAAGITGNGHTVYYDATQAANSWLEGKTYNLTGGGTLTPMV
jgi:hypothetical protein